MISIHVHLKANAYDIVIGHNILPHLGKRLNSLGLGENCVVITNPVVQRLHGRALLAGLKKSGIRAKVIAVPAGERAKSAAVANRVIERVARQGGRKKIFIIAFGGGVIGDLAGYVAAVYKRGVPYVQVPTTLLAQVDSAIGGKVAIDLPFGKNLVGAFYQPKVVWSDIKTLSTLTKRQIQNGLAEAVKYGAIADKKLFLFLSRNMEKLLRLDSKALVRVVERSSRIKAKVVAADELDTKGIRAILNFGHTVGHAIEAAGKYNQYRHGEAIALGMRVAAHISLQQKLCSPTDVRALN